jgi:hypothetical protein
MEANTTTTTKKRQASTILTTYLPLSLAASKKPMSLTSSNTIIRKREGYMPSFSNTLEEDAMFLLIRTCPQKRHSQGIAMYI